LRTELLRAVEIHAASSHAFYQKPSSAEADLPETSNYDLFLIRDCGEIIRPVLHHLFPFIKKLGSIIGRIHLPNTASVSTSSTGRARNSLAYSSKVIAHCARCFSLRHSGDLAARSASVLQPIWQAKPETASRFRGRIETVLDAARAKGHMARNEVNPARRWHLDKLLAKRQKLTRGHHAAMPKSLARAGLNSILKARCGSFQPLA
jgi:hypothetical protein